MGVQRVRDSVSYLVGDGSGWTLGLDRLYLAARRCQFDAGSALPSGSAFWTLPLDRLYLAARRCQFDAGSALPSGSVFSVGASCLRPICVTKRLGVRIVAFETYWITSTKRLGVFCGCVGSAPDLRYQAARRANSGV